ncbi:FecR family protein [Quatrionicoccus australiensis]|uniref:FecR family protein n=1 Tax=Quatrionicoccus australiensis TaxID=138118 RepID=UPI001CFB2551|nr:FecR domain-containing protein [Quatrionicoccus australiensis]MCB4362079.1 FecR domain-containing protein [Quatrionicoccus australiensis]
MPHSPQASPAADNSERAQEEAAFWFARLHGENVSREERATFAGWLAGSPENAREFGILEQIWNHSACLAPQAKPRARRLLHGAAGLAAMALLASWLFHTAPGELVATGIGERKHLQLSDGSELDLAPRTRLHFRLDKDQRHIELHEGQIAINVGADPQRPLEVVANGHHIRDIGTRFVVETGAKQTRVSVAEGLVEIRPANGDAATQRLAAGEEVSVTDGKIGPVLAVDRSILLAWTKGQLAFEGQPLNEVIATLNRFRKTPIILDEPNLGGMRISGVFLIDKEETALIALRQIAGLRFLESNGMVHASTDHSR